MADYGKISRHDLNKATNDELDGLQNQITNNDSDIETLKKRATTDETNINSNTTNITNHEARLETIEKTVIYFKDTEPVIIDPTKNYIWFDTVNQIIYTSHWDSSKGNVVDWIPQGAVYK